MKKTRSKTKSTLTITAITLALTLLSACGGGEKTNSNANTTPTTNLALTLALPNSMTGGIAQAAAITTNTQAQNLNRVSSNAVLLSNAVNASANAHPCGFIGVSDNEPLRNGHQMGKMMISAVATWTCVADKLITLSTLFTHDDIIIETENDSSAANYDPQEPTHFSISDDSATQTTIRIYYRYNRTTPPRIGDDPQFYISWNNTSTGTNDHRLDGKLVIDGLKIQANNRKADDPIKMRLDFKHTNVSKEVDMFLQFDSGNLWAEGFRINVSKDLTASPLNTVFVARGLIKMKNQFIPVTGVTEVPTITMIAVSDSFGNGAAIAEFQDVSLPIELNAATNNHLGNYIFTKTDNYYFQANQQWDWIEKSITRSEYRGARTTPTISSGLADDPTLADIRTALNLDSNYFTGALCATIGDDCNALLNSIYQDGFYGHEQNQGSKPADWRSAALANPNYLLSVYPNGADWFAAFDFSFTPSLN